MAQAIASLLTGLHGGGARGLKALGAGLVAAVALLGLAARLARVLQRRAGLAGPVEARAAVKLYRSLLLRLHRRGVEKRAGQTPRELVAELRRQGLPQAQVASEVTERYLEARFGRRPLARDEVRRWRGAIRAL